MWKINYDNDVGGDDDYFVEWWEVTDGERTYKCSSEEDAQFLVNALDGKGKVD